MKKLTNSIEWGQLILNPDLKMKTSLSLIVTAFFQLQASSGYAQKEKITLDMANVTVLDVMQEIESVSEFKFFYSKEELNLNRKVNLKVNGELITPILKTLFSKGDTSYKIVEKQIVLTSEPVLKLGYEAVKTPKSLMKNVQFSVSGTVTDSDEVALPGANVIEKGIKNGVQTDFDGKFTLEVADENTILSISYIGFEAQEIALNGKTTINIALKVSTAALDEVVLTGIRGAEQRAIAAKKAAPSVVETISPQDLGNFSDENIGDALRRVPGVQIQEDQTGGQDGGTRVSIRGIGPAFVQTTINGRQPLSAGLEGGSAFRQFNVNVLPPEVLNGATIYKSSEAGLVEPGLGGSVNFNTLRPLDVNYKRMVTIEAIF